MWRKTPITDPVALVRELEAGRASEAGRALAEMRDGTSAELLTSSLRRGVREAADVLASRPDGVDLLVAELASGSVTSSELACGALARCGHADALERALFARQPPGRWLALRALMAVAPTRCEALLPSLMDDPTVGEEARRLWKRLHPAPADRTELLAHAALGDPLAVHMLRKAPDPQNLPLFRSLLSHPIAWLEAALAVADLGDAESLPTLRALADRERPALQPGAPDAVRALAEAIRRLEGA